MDSPIVRQELRDDDVEVLYQGRWWWGRLKAWRLHEDGSWSAWVKHEGPDGNRISVVGVGEVRPVDTSTLDPK